MAGEIEGRVQAALRGDELGQQLADVDIENAELLVRSTLTAIDPRIEVIGFGERARGIVRELEIDWQIEGAAHSEVVPLREVSV